MVIKVEDNIIEIDLNIKIWFKKKRELDDLRKTVNKFDWRLVESGRALNTSLALTLDKERRRKYKVSNFVVNGLKKKEGAQKFRISSKRRGPSSTFLFFLVSRASFLLY